VVHKHDTVLFPSGHGAGGAGCHTPGVLAVETGHENIGSPGNIIDQLRADFDYLAKPWPYGQRLVAFTLDFTCMAADALFGVLYQVIFAHSVLHKIA